MKALTKLKDDARKHEQKEEWDKAIQLYLDVIRTAEEGESELPLYNRVGDLYVRMGRPNDAVTYYEKAADRYGEAGLFNNAIALCNKALRYLPSRTELLRKLGQFSASQGFITEARRWYLEYAERKLKEGALDEAFEALDDFASVHEDAEVREMLGRQLLHHNRRAHAVQELKRAYDLRQAAGQSDVAVRLMDEILGLDPDAFSGDAAETPRPSQPAAFDVPSIEQSQPAAPATAPEPIDLGLETTAASFGADASADPGLIDLGDLNLPGLETTELLSLEPAVEQPSSFDAPLADIETGFADSAHETPAAGGIEAEPLDLEPIDFGAGGDFDPGLVDLDATSLGETPLPGTDDTFIEPLPLIDSGIADEPADSEDVFELPLLEEPLDFEAPTSFESGDVETALETESFEPLPLLGIDEEDTAATESLPDLAFDGPVDQDWDSNALQFEVETAGALTEDLVGESFEAPTEELFDAAALFEVPAAEPAPAAPAFDPAVLDLEDIGTQDAPDAPADFTPTHDDALHFDSEAPGNIGAVQFEAETADDVEPVGFEVDLSEQVEPVEFAAEQDAENASAALEFEVPDAFEPTGVIEPADAIEPVVGFGSADVIEPADAFEPADVFEPADAFEADALTAADPVESADAGAGAAETGLEATQGDDETASGFDAPPVSGVPDRTEYPPFEIEVVEPEQEAESVAEFEPAAPVEEEGEVGEEFEEADYDSGEEYEDEEDDLATYDWAKMFAAAKDFAHRGEVAAAVEELLILHEDLAANEMYAEALAVTEELVRLEPGSLNHLQQRVEYAAKVGEGEALLRAYLELADRLARSGAAVKANAIYQRVLDIDPTNAAARNALYASQQPVRSNSEGYVDLFSLLTSDEEDAGTRFVVAEKPPTGDEERDFADMLAQFKQKLADHVPFDDSASHYDLGLAFKEMGLVDEAIAEFQTALKGGQERLKIYEELGQCFLLKQQYTIAITILNRAVNMGADEADLVGVYYHIGRSYEELGQRTEAKSAYERVVGVDISFKDAAERLTRL